MLALRINEHKPVSELAVSEVSKPGTALGDVLVEIRAAGINPSDVISAEGRFPHSVLPRILGRDFAGVVVEGPDELVGKDVCGSGGDLGISRDGTHAEYLSIPAGGVVIRPGNLSAEQAASIGVPFTTAWMATVERGGLKEGEWVAIVGANGAVGSACVQIASALRANVIAIVRDSSLDEQIDRVKVAAIAHLDKGDLTGIVQSLTAGKGIDLAINGVGGNVFQPLFDCLALFGRMSIFSIIGGRDVDLNLQALYRRNITLHGVNSVDFDATESATILRKMVPMIESGALIAPDPVRRLPLSMASEAYQTISEGKTVLAPDRFFK